MAPELLAIALRTEAPGARLHGVPPASRHWHAAGRADRQRGRECAGGDYVPPDPAVFKLAQFLLNVRPIAMERSHHGNVQFAVIPFGGTAFAAQLVVWRGSAGNRCPYAYQPSICNLAGSFPFRRPQGIR